MTEPNLLLVCVTAFFAVVLLLGLLAGVIRLLTAVFPERVPEDTGAAVVAAIHSAVARAYPSARVTRIEEIR
jgi:hypothetical protein